MHNPEYIEYARLRRHRCCCFFFVLLLSVSQDRSSTSAANHKHKPFDIMIKSSRGAAAPNQPTHPLYVRSASRSNHKMHHRTNGMRCGWREVKLTSSWVACNKNTIHFVRQIDEVCQTDKQRQNGCSFAQFCCAAAASRMTIVSPQRVDLELDLWLINYPFYDPFFCFN